MAYDGKKQLGWAQVRRDAYEQQQVPVGQSPPPPLQQSQPGTAGPEQGHYVRLPGGNFRPPGSTSVDELGDANIAPAGNAVLVTITIPVGQRFTMDRLGFHADDGAALGFLTWSLVWNGVAVPGYVGVSSAVGSIRNPVPIGIVFYAITDLSTVTVVGFADAAAVLTYRYAAHVIGWFYQEEAQGN